jgi:hypothetical protein
MWLTPFRKPDFYLNDDDKSYALQEYPDGYPEKAAPMKTNACQQKLPTSFIAECYAGGWQNI